MNTWTIHPHLMTMGSQVGRAVSKLNGRSAERLPSEILESIYSEELRTVPLYIDADSLKFLDAKDALIISKYRKLWVSHSIKDTWDLSLISYRLVYALSADFYEMIQLTGTDLIVGNFSFNLLNDTYRLTHFENYFMLPERVDELFSIRDFLNTSEGQFWRLSMRCFEEVSLGDLERMFYNE